MLAHCPLEAAFLPDRIKAQAPCDLTGTPNFTLLPQAESLSPPAGRIHVQREKQGPGHGHN